MVSRINLLRNIGQFDSTSLNVDLPVGAIILIHAENGRGKTTLANIFRSLSTGNPDPVVERQRLGTQQPPHIVLKINNKTYSFQDSLWSSQLSDIKVFDEHFVAQNIYSGIEIDPEHRQNLHELILGAEGLSLNTALQGHINEIEKHNKSLKEKEKAILSIGISLLTTEKFCNLPKNNNIDNDIQETERKLSAARSSATIQQQAEFSAIRLPDFDIEEINALLQRDLPGLQAEAAARIQNHLAKLGKEAESWISEGVQKIAIAPSNEGDSLCPFCAQPLEHSPIIAHYEGYFSKAYANLKKEIIEQISNTKETHGKEAPASFERAVSEVIQSCEFWKAFTEVPDIKIDTARFACSWKVARDLILAALQAKLASPLDKIVLPEEAIKAIDNYNKCQTELSIISETLITLNSKTALVKEQCISANIESLNNDLTILKLTQARYTHEIDSLCKDYLKGKEAKEEIEKKRDKLRQALDNYRTDIFSKYEGDINAYLQKLTAGFRLRSFSPVNIKSGSSCTYELIINNVSVPLRSTTGASFKNTLSAGDRNTLALAFFFASLNQDPFLEEKIVIIDDPMTSLDEHRSLATIQLIRELVKRVKQVIILSHSKPFLCQIWEGADVKKRHALKLGRSAQSSTIENWDVHQDCITENDRRHKLVTEYITASDSASQRAVAQALRPILEAFLRVAYPIDFPPGSMLGNFHSLCQKHLRSPKQILNKEDTAEIGLLKDYANRFHHDTNPAWATEIINDQELLSYCTRTIKFIRKT